MSPPPEYFVAHGRHDATIPSVHAYQVVRFLEDRKASVVFCEADTGHKLSVACFKQLENFFLQPKSI
jgi:predicted esterase